MREETGFRAGRLEKLLDFYSHPGYMAHKVHLLVAYDLEWDPLEMDDGEEIQVHMFTLAEALAATRADSRCDPEAALALWSYAGRRKLIMATPLDPPKDDNVYLNDPESAAEMARLLEQDRLITKGMGGLFPERGNDFSGIHRILDVACGPGGWVQEVAFAHPEIEVVGFDISRAMIDFARAQARVQGLANASFLVMDVQNPLDFADSSFDLVTVRFINFLPAAAWPKLMQELRRITRPGGIIRLTESEWWYFTTSPALENLNALVIRAIKMQGGYSQTGRFTGILPMLGRLLLDIGCVNVKHVPHVIDFSVGTEAYEGFRRDASVVFKLFQPFIIKMGVATQEELAQLYAQMLTEMQRDDFRGLMLPLTVLGEKP